MATTYEEGVENGERLPPGTVHLVDLYGTMATKHAGQNEKDIILVPRPSEDPEDPLNWTMRRKLLATSCVVVYTIMLAIPSSAVYSVVTPIRKATGLSLADINNGTGIMVRLSLSLPHSLPLSLSNKPVPLLRLGLSLLATPRAAVRKAPGVFVLAHHQHCHPGHRAALHHTPHLPGQPHPARPLWLARGVAV